MKDAREIALHTLSYNIYCAQPDDLLLGMLGDSDVNLRKKAVDIILVLRE